MYPSNIWLLVAPWNSQVQNWAPNPVCKVKHSCLSTISCLVNTLRSFIRTMEAKASWVMLSIPSTNTSNQASWLPVLTNNIWLPKGFLLSRSLDITILYSKQCKTIFKIKKKKQIKKLGFLSVQVKTLSTNSATKLNFGVTNNFSIRFVVVRFVENKTKTMTKKFKIYVYVSNLWLIC